jgi:hypothetical protein
LNLTCNIAGEGQRLAWNGHFPVGNMDSRSTSEVLLAFGQKDMERFYRAWCGKNTFPHMAQAQELM